MTEQEHITTEGLEARRRYKREYMRRWRATHRENVKRSEIRHWNRVGARAQQVQPDKE